MRGLPNIVLMAPRDEASSSTCSARRVYDDGPIALRYPRGEGEGVALPAPPNRSRSGAASCCARASGWPCSATATACRSRSERPTLLSDEHGVDPTVADACFAKPLDAELVERLAAEHDLLVTVEENVLAGGFGSGVLEHLADRDRLGGTRVLRIGLPDRFVTHGKPALLRKEVGLTPEADGRSRRPGGARADRRPGLITAYTDG